MQINCLNCGKEFNAEDDLIKDIEDHMREALCPDCVKEKYHG